MLLAFSLGHIVIDEEAIRGWNEFSLNATLSLVV